MEPFWNIASISFRFWMAIGNSRVSLLWYHSSTCSVSMQALSLPAMVILAASKIATLSAAVGKSLPLASSHSVLAAIESGAWSQLTKLSLMIAGHSLGSSCQLSGRVSSHLTTVGCSAPIRLSSQAIRLAAGDHLAVGEADLRVAAQRRLDTPD